MNLTYQVLSEKEETVIKFFYEDVRRYGEFYMRLNRESINTNNPTSPIGVHGKAVLEAKDEDYAFPLLQGISEALEFVKKCDVCGNLFKSDRRPETCDHCWEEIQNDHMGDIDQSALSNT